MSTFGIFLFVVVQRASVPWLLQQAKVDGAYPFSSSSIVVSVTFLEIILGVSLACSTRGVHRGIVETLHPRELKKWFFIGISQAVSDMLELYANKYLDASTYQVLLQSKLMVTAILLAMVTKKGVNQSSLEWLLLIALSVGLATYSILSNGSGNFSGIGTVLALLKVLLSCGNAVFTEQILKQSEGTPVMHQIVHMKVFWCFWSVVCMALLEGPSAYAPSCFFRGWGKPVLLVMATYVVKNWSGTFILKRLDSLRKNIAEAFAMLMLYLLEISPFFGNKTLETPTLCVTVMVVLLVWSYLECKQRLVQQTTGKRVGFRQLLDNPSLYHSGTSRAWPLQRQGRRLGKKYGLLPTHSVTAMSQAACRVVANKNAGHSAGAASTGILLDPQPCHRASGAALVSMGSLLDLTRSVIRKESGAVMTSMNSLPDLKRVDGNDVVDLESPLVRHEESFGLIDQLQVLLQAAVGYGPDKDWRSSVSQALDICKGLKPYLEETSSPPSPGCQAIAYATRNTDWAALHAAGETCDLYHPAMMTTQVQSQMLGFFCSMLSAKRILEVGMFTGFATLCMAEAAPQSHVKAIEHDPYLAGVAQRHFDRSALGSKIEVICGNALDVLGGMAVAVNDESRFDLIYIDGNKLQHLDYFKLIDDRDLLSPGGLICINETLWRGCVYSAGDSEDEVAATLRELNKAISSNPKLVSVVLPIRNGLTLVRRLDDHVAGEHDHFSSTTLLFPSSRLKRGHAVTQRRVAATAQQQQQQVSLKTLGSSSGNTKGLHDPQPLASRNESDGELKSLPHELFVPQPGCDGTHDSSGAGFTRQTSEESTSSELPIFERMQTC